MKNVSCLAAIVFSAACAILVSGCDLFAIGTAADERDIGINLHADQCDWSEDRLFADAMKTAREWTEAGQYGSGARVPVDANGWPTTDAEVAVWHGIDRMNGTYRLEGSSATEPIIEAGFGGADIRNLAFADGRFSADVVYGSRLSTGLLLTFRNTGGGVRDMSLMRPVLPGSTASYPRTATFTDQAKKLVAKFHVVRFMWATDAWNGPWQVHWTDRVQPTYCSMNRSMDSPYVGWAGKGMAWEYAIQFCNETGKDLWINMPLGADDDYVANLARLVRDAYTVPDGKIYWEYSNEATWDAAGITSSYLRQTAVAEAAAGGPVGYDGLTDTQVLPCRYYAERMARMSLVWRSVWGDDAMMRRVRPVVCGQLGYDGQAGWGLDFVQNWFGNGDGNHVLDPHPVNYFFYGCGGSHYSGDDPDLESGGVSQIDAFESFEEEEACNAKMYGLVRCAYEGGVWTGHADYLSPRIEDAMVRYHELWDKYDGGVLSYFVTTGGEDGGTALGFTLDPFNLDTPKYRALARLHDGRKPRPQAGKVAPCSIWGADFSSNSVIWEHPAPGGKESLGPAQLDEWRTYKGYLFRVMKPRRFSLSLEFERAVPGSLIEVMVDGVVIAKEGMDGDASPGYSIDLAPGLHAVRVKKYSPGYFMLKRIVVE